jgi:hypothetical protein
MAVDDQVKVLEDEFKLIKSEVRQTLVSVRDFLLDMKLPPMQEEPVVPTQGLALSNDNESEKLPQNDQANSPQQPSNENGGGSTSGAGNSDSSPLNEEVQDVVPEINNPVEEENIDMGNDMEMEDLQNLASEDSEDNGMTSGDIPSDIEPEKKNEKQEPVSQINSKDNQSGIVSSDSQINLLANLIRWVSIAKKEIGNEQLPAFLNVYSVGGNMSEEIKDVILHLAEVATDPVSGNLEGAKAPVVNEEISLCMEINSLSGQLPEDIKKSIRRLTEILIQQTVQRNKADVWSKLLIELHGILSGNTATLQYLITRESREAEQLKKEQEALEKAESLKAENAAPRKTAKPAKLRLVLPGSDGSEQELDLGNLFIASDQDNDGNGHNKLSVS